MIFKPEGRRFYIVKFHHEGKTIQKRTKASTAKAARNIEAKIRTELANGNFGILAAARPPLLTDFLRKEFLPFVEANCAAKPKTVSYYGYGVARLISSELAKLQIDHITSQQIAAFTAQQCGLSPSTVNCALRTLKRALKVAEQWGKLPKAPSFELVKGERQRDRVVTDAEFQAYSDACREPWRDVVILLYGTGMRPGEVFALQWQHVLLNGNGGLIQIAEGKTAQARRLLPMVPAVYGTLKARFESQGSPSEGWVFPSGSASGHFDQNSAKNQHTEALKKLAAAHATYKKWKKEGCNGDWIEAACKQSALSHDYILEHSQVVESGLKRFEPYCLRHTALTRLAEAGCDAFTLAKIAGHSSITITQRYCHPQAEAIERAFSRVKDHPAVLKA